MAANLLSSPIVQSLLRAHPNSFQDSFGDLLDIHFRNLLLPTFRHPLLDDVRRFQLDRTPVDFENLLGLPSEQGMSPKKRHEVARMATYIVNSVREQGLDTSRLHIVDVGAGQGYLTRALKYHLQDAHILALDADQDQTTGAQRWETRLIPSLVPRIAHKTVLISADTLSSTISEWVDEGKFEIPVPVLLVALHACGSLTLDVLRTFTINLKTPRPTWYPAGVVTVGCCYNLMNPGGG